MKTPEEHLQKVTSLTPREELYKIGEQIQIDAYNEALYDVTNKLVGILHDESDIDTIDLLYQKLNDLKQLKK